MERRARGSRSSSCRGFITCEVKSCGYVNLVCAKLEGPGQIVPAGPAMSMTPLIRG